MDASAKTVFDSQASYKPTFESYAQKYPHVHMERRDGILEMRLHTDGGSAVWGPEIHEELGYLFADVAADRENAVVIITGTGDAFCDRYPPPTPAFPPSSITTQDWDLVYFDGKRLINNLLAIEVPVIGAVNGPATIHAELALLSDIVIASENATFRDAPHFANNLVPGDNVQVLWPLLLGFNRGRYFLLTGQELSAQEALKLGVISEVVIRDQLLPRAWELAEMIAERSFLTRRYTRATFVHQLQRLMHENLGYGLVMEGAAAVQTWPSLSWDLSAVRSSAAPAPPTVPATTA